MVQVTEQLIQQMTDTIVQEVKPRKVILFGSHARGTARSDSDLDFLIVEDGPFNAQRSRRKEMARLWRLFMNCRIPLDFLVYTPEEIEERQYARNHVIAYALKDGKVLYECL